MSESRLSRFSLEGKVALVTGASRGIGEEIAATYAEAGARVVICGRKPAGLDEAAQRIGKGADRVLPVVANVSSGKDRENLVRAAMEWAGRIDILVNNAGTNPGYGPLAEVAESAWDKAFEVNLKSPLFLSQLVYRAWMQEHGGTILNIASVGGFLTTTGINTYNVTKAALVHLTRCLACEWGQSGVRVNALAPGLIKTRLSQAMWEDPAVAGSVEAQPVPRLGTVGDLAGAALLLASDASSFVTGHVLVIDGGRLVCTTG